ncbi:hypothetical protein EDD22DRAFT_1050827 [Suillus occidentalis]|nr:hypothetical protein EDD22DRAFT_1050827 [Suillus occidentalis]
MSANAAVINSDGGCPILCATQNCCAGQKCKPLGLVYSVLTCVKGTSELRALMAAKVAQNRHKQPFKLAESFAKGVEVLTQHMRNCATTDQPKTSHPTQWYRTRASGRNCTQVLGSIGSVSHRDIHIEPLDDNMSWPSWVTKRFGDCSGYAYYYGIRDGKLSLLS